MKKHAIMLVTAACCWPVAARRLPAPRPAAATAEATRLIAVLRSNAATFDKARACQQLAVLGSKEAVPALADLLADEKLAAYARCGLESIADPAAADALRAAAGPPARQAPGGRGQLDRRSPRRQGRRRVGRDRGGRSSGAAAEALTALGRIATPEAVEILQRASRPIRPRPGRPPPTRA